MAATIRIRRRLALILLSCGWVLGADAAPAAPSIAWQPWRDDLFAQAAREHRFVLLDLEAVWCHWCHVMDVDTWRDPSVIALLSGHYLAVKVDQESRPDLANRYEDYGWPAIVVYAPDGTELVKRSGYLPGPGMAAMLQAVIDDPTPGPSIRVGPEPAFASTVLEPKLRAILDHAFEHQFDEAQAGWGFQQKLLDADSLEYAMSLARAGDSWAQARAQRTLDALHSLIDPVWGGLYQYSTGGDWKSPHFEKIMSVQATGLRSYSLAWLQWHRPADLAAAQAIDRFLQVFLTSPEGALYTSQDADVVSGEHSDGYFALDDTARRSRGIPRVDRHRYARENGWAIEALAIHAAAGGSTARDRAIRAARWVIANRSLDGGGFRHDDQDDRAGPYLGDSLAMGRAFLALHALTGEQEWLDRAVAAARFIDRRFGNDEGAGYRTAAHPSAGYAPRPQRDENVGAARFSNLLGHYTADPAVAAMTTKALRVVTDPLAAQRFPAASALLVQSEIEREPVHVTVVGARDDGAAIALYAAATRLPLSYRRLQWWDRREGPLARSDISFPRLARAAAYVCTADRCSAPLFDPEQLPDRVATLTRIPSDP